VPEHPNSSPSPPRLAGALLFSAGAAILMGIITAEALYPAAYTTFSNEISDLGATRPPHSVSYQPSAAIFDITMLMAGAMILVAAWLVHRAFKRRAVTISLACYGLGVFGVGVFPGNTAPHPYVAMFVFIAAAVLWLTVVGGYLMGSAATEPPRRAQPPAAGRTEDAGSLVGGARRGPTYPGG
jgi:hypothetical membrane protein